MAKIAALPANLLSRKGAATAGDATKAAPAVAAVAAAPAPEPVQAPAPAAQEAAPAPAQQPQVVAGQLVAAVGALALPTRGDARAADMKRPMVSLTIKVEDIVHKELRRYCFDIDMTVQNACRRAIIHALRNAGVPLEGVQE
jgi:hypothetical protein